MVEADKSDRVGIFLSSTFKDLKGHRKVIIDEITRLREDFHGMELFGARNEEPTTASLSEIDKCSIFIGLYAHRYGTKSNPDKSITEMEFDYATERGLTRLCYFLNSEFRWPPRFVDRGEDAPKLDAFKKKIQQSCTPDWFTTPDNLAKKVISDLYDLLKERYPKQEILSISDFTIPQAPTPYIAHGFAFKKHFTGRTSERKMLSNWLEDEHPIITLVGMGGLGKSSLTWHWLHRDVIDKKKFDGIIWWSFYESDSAFERFLQQSIRYVAPEHKTVQLDGFSGRDLCNALLNKLKERNFLILFDGAERTLFAYSGLGSPYTDDDTVGKSADSDRETIDPNFGYFLTRFASEFPKSKLILTTRLLPLILEELEGCHKPDLGGLTSEETIEFFGKNKIRGTRAEIIEAAERCGYHPLWLALLAGMIVNDPKYPCDMSGWRENNPMPDLTGKEGHHILEVTFEATKLERQKVLSRIAAFRFPVDYQTALVCSVYKKEDEFKEALKDLIGRELLQFDNLRGKYDLHPLVRMYAYERLKNPESFHETVVEILEGVSEIERLKSVDDLYPVIELFHHTIRAGRYREALTLFRDRLASPLFRFSAHHIRADLLTTFFPNENENPILGNPSAVAWVLNAIAITRSQLGEWNIAKSLLQRHNKLQEILNKKINLAIGLINLSVIDQKLGNTKEAKSNLKKAIEIGLNESDKEVESHARRELAELLLMFDNLSEAEEELVKSRKLAQSLSVNRDIGRKRGKTNIPSSWLRIQAKISIEKGNLPNARNEVEEAFDSSRKYESKKEQLESLYLLGHIQRLDENFSDALPTLNSALQQCQELSLVSLEPEILLELAEVHRGTEDGESAQRHAEEALRIATRCASKIVMSKILIFQAKLVVSKHPDVAKRKLHQAIGEIKDCGNIKEIHIASELLKILKKKN